jgi:hypothetical protein
MAKIKKLVVRHAYFADFSFHCPGCNCDHDVWTTAVNSSNAIWQFNGDLEKPTITPSIRVQWGNGNICHSHITDGKIQFLTDSTHELAGKTVELPDFE